MRIHGRPYRTIWTRPDESVEVIDQTRLPHRFETVVLKTAEDCAVAIRTMVVRGAPLIGATAAYGVAFAMKKDPSSKALIAALDLLGSTRPTAINLQWALKRMHDALHNRGHGDRFQTAWAEAPRVRLPARRRSMFCSRNIISAAIRKKSLKG